MILAQSTDVAQVPIPDIAWSAFAPELLPTAAALLLLLVAIAGHRRQALIGIPTALLGVVLGAALIARGVVIPGAVAIGFAAAVPAAIAVVPRKPTLIGAWVAAASLVGALILTVWQFVEMTAPGAATMAPQVALQGSLANDGIAFFTRLTVYLTALLVIPLGQGYLTDRAINRAEVQPLLLLSVVGMVALGAANDLITLFVALELLSFALYILCGLARRDRRSQEASLKYFITGSVASAILLYGMALLYTATGSVDLPTIGRTLGLVTTQPVIAALGLVLVTVGVGFKVALAPFHLWTPDVYQGAPTNVTAFMAAATKAAGFAAILRLYLVAFPSLQALWVPSLSVLAAITMLYGAYVAVVQHDIKRMLAYSSITHAGYTTIGVVALSDAGLSATLWYLMTYAVATVGAFGCVIALERRRRGEVTLVDLRGLGRTSPALAGILAICLLSLAGVPATAGFVGKVAIFEAGVSAGLTWLVVVGVISSVIAAFFYLRIAGTMFLESTPVDQPMPIVTPGVATGIAVSAALVVYLGVQPQVVLQLADSAAALVR
ncbi:MAG: NADH-quinone oxidoreductase subunit N [Nitriliruptor sp.]|uniref:NADH-quinone oxidoreductase subunit N n=1 Tax=Nitriliruptor sp. TaxID=2448056 RepID=UPI0034A04AEB